MFLDAECAWWGDPAFDLAFCLNHLMLKCLWVPAAHGRLLESFQAIDEPTCRLHLGTGQPRWKHARRICCPPCSWRGSMASRR